MQATCQARAAEGRDLKIRLGATPSNSRTRCCLVRISFPAGTIAKLGVVPGMIGVRCEDLKVLGSVVVSDAVDMVYYFFSS